MHLVIVRHGGLRVEQAPACSLVGLTLTLPRLVTRRQQLAAVLSKKAGYDFVCYTSLLKRAIHTLNHVLDELNVTGFCSPRPGV